VVSTLEQGPTGGGQYIPAGWVHNEHTAPLGLGDFDPVSQVPLSYGLQVSIYCQDQVVSVARLLVDHRA
jgi:hypothetical protein